MKRSIAIAACGLVLSASPIFAQQANADRLAPDAPLSGFTHQEYMTGDGLYCGFVGDGNDFDCDEEVVNGACAFSIAGTIANGQLIYLSPSSSNDADCYPSADGGSIVLRVYSVHRTASNITAQVSSDDESDQLNGCASSVTGQIVLAGDMKSHQGFMIDANLDIAWAGYECQPPIQQADGQ